MPEPDTGSAAADLTEFLTRLYGVVEHPPRVRSLRGMMADARLDPDFRAAFQDWIDGHRRVVIEPIERGIARGELDPALDVEYATDLVFGPFWYRLLAGDAPLDPADAAGHIARLHAGLRSR
ncbi:TetR-like C-terminal domain-containing protein [Nocardia acidivorans]|uniref:TetR-like C-terminal domain-containing protein n=1 Tax=Nocardia acidivorans TaxID=404580 RepID=UPI00082A3CF5|nr:TetR-like C-terminal domain-containing protein [Nocardia acidivorans]